jgi:hypothetical protein
MEIFKNIKDNVRGRINKVLKQTETAQDVLNNALTFSKDAALLLSLVAGVVVTGVGVAAVGVAATGAVATGLIVTSPITFLVFSTSEYSDAIITFTTKISQIINSNLFSPSTLSDLIGKLAYMIKVVHDPHLRLGRNLLIRHYAGQNLFKFIISYYNANYELDQQIHIIYKIIQLILNLQHDEMIDIEKIEDKMLEKNGIGGDSLFERILEVGHDVCCSYGIESQFQIHDANDIPVFK